MIEDKKNFSTYHALCDMSHKAWFSNSIFRFLIIGFVLRGFQAGFIGSVNDGFPCRTT